MLVETMGLADRIDEGLELADRVSAQFEAAGMMGVLPDVLLQQGKLFLKADRRDDGVASLRKALSVARPRGLNRIVGLVDDELEALGLGSES